MASRQLPVLQPQTYRGGTTPDTQPAARVPGRYAVVQAEGKFSLYVPEVQMLFRLPDDIARTLAQASQDLQSPAYAEARQFVTELIRPHRGVPLQNRDRNNQLRDLVVHPSQICNLDCKYCYAHEINQVNRTMERRVADQLVSRAMKMAGPEGLSSVKFLGGEPTIAWDIVEHLVLAFQDAHNRLASVRMPAFVLVTNGTLVSSRIIDFIVRNQMYVLVSLDGTREIHDHLRPSKSGGGSYGRASESLRQLLAAGADVAVESVYTKQHIDEGITPLSMLNHFRAMGVRETHITIPLGTWHELHTIEEIERTTDGFVEAARASVRSFRTDDPFLLRGVTSVLDGLLLAEDREYVCGAGRSFMAVNYDGEAFPCYLLESAQTSYGFIDDRWDEARHQEISRTYRTNGKLYHPVCRECWNNELCQLCQGYSFAIDQRVSKSPVWFCKFIKEITAAVLGEVAVARDSVDWDRLLENMKSSLLNPQKPFVPAVRDPDRNAVPLPAIPRSS
jgi:uncharacterized protein